VERGLSTVNPAVSVAVAFGSNLGQRDAHIQRGLALAALFVDGVRVSSTHETACVGTAGPQPPFLNGAFSGTTTLSARELLRALLDIERVLGRTRPYQDAPRPLDLDLILYGADIIDEPGLVVPHPRFRQRRFVLEPLAEVAADWLDPVSGRRVEELLRNLVV
jgi:2-amino-4-hydroxy-6-hydroxymethyldihydropteridine diphosphokinase